MSRVATTAAGVAVGAGVGAAVGATVGAVGGGAASHSGRSRWIPDGPINHRVPPGALESWL
jgi:hypothetical protein